MLARKLGVSADYLETGSEIRDSDERELRIADAELELRLAGRSAEAEDKLEQAARRGAGRRGRTSPPRARASLSASLPPPPETTPTRSSGSKQGSSSRPSRRALRPDVFATLGHAYSASGRPDKRRRAVQRVPRRARGARRRRPRRADQVHHLPQLRADRPRRPRRARRRCSTRRSRRPRRLTDAYSRVRLYWSLARLNDVRGQAALRRSTASGARSRCSRSPTTRSTSRAHTCSAPTS